jgi:hypothetical protein
MEEKFSDLLADLLNAGYFLHYEQLTLIPSKKKLAIREQQVQQARERLNNCFTRFSVKP